MKVALTKKQIEQASKKANKDRLPLSGVLISAMRRVNEAQNFKPLWKSLDKRKIKELEKLIRGEK